MYNSASMSKLFKILVSDLQHILDKKHSLSTQIYLQNPLLDPDMNRQAIWTIKSSDVLTWIVINYLINV